MINGMTKRKYGYTWILGVWSSEWARKGYKGLRTDGPDDCFVHYMKFGDFTEAQKLFFLPSVRKYYELDCRRRGETPVPFPPRLEEQINRLVKEGRKAAK